MLKLTSTIGAVKIAWILKKTFTHELDKRTNMGMNGYVFRITDELQEDFYSNLAEGLIDNSYNGIGLGS